MCLGKREIWIEFGGALEKFHRRRAAFRHIDRLRCAVCLQRFERSRCGLDQRYLVLLDRGQRLADARSEFASNLAQSVQDVFLLRCLRLFVVEDLSRPTSLRAQAQDVLAAKARDGALQYRCAVASLAHLVGNLQGKLRICRLLHQPECAMNALVGNQAQEWRLFKLNRQPLAKRLVKDGVPCRVREIGEDDGVLVRQSWCGMKIEVPAPTSASMAAAAGTITFQRFAISVVTLNAGPAVTRPASVSRLRRWRSVRMSDACW